MLGLFALAAAAAMTPNELPSFEPTANLSAVRQIDCDEGQGSGYLIADNVLATALHVASLTNCVDHETRKPLTTYKRDEEHDFALMTGDYPDFFPYMKYSCEPFHKDEKYIAYGYSGYGYKAPFYTTMFRMGTLIGTGDKTGDDFMVGGEGNKKTPMPGLSILRGRTAPGTSGGAIVDLNGYVHGGVNVGTSLFGIPMRYTMSYALHDTILCRPRKGLL